MAVVGNKGVDASISLNEDRDIFSESLSRAIVEVSLDNLEAFEKFTAQVGVDCIRLGLVGGEKIIINDIYKELSDTRELYYNKFQQVIEQDL